MNKYRLTSRKAKRKRILIPVVIALIAGLGIGVFFLVRHNKSKPQIPTLSAIHASWVEKNYQLVLDQTTAALRQKPDDSTLLALQGFAFYYLAIAQTNETDEATYIDSCIASLRKALYTINKEDAPRLWYVLGKAYYQKGYFYSDLALKYLNMASDSKMNFDDLHKFQGMAYSELGLNEEAINAFTLDLDENADEFLLYALAKNYVQVENYDKAKMYLSEAINKAKDVLLKLDCMNTLADIFLTEGNTEKAMEQYQNILAIDEKYADAYYGLGIIYEQQGNLVKARAEWRNALKANPLHAKAQEKLH